MKPSSLCAVAALCTTVFTSCDRLQEKMEITETREVSEFARSPAVDIPSSTRFYDDTPAQPAAGQSPSLRGLLVWEVPQGWTELPEEASSSMRMIDIRFGPNNEGECYVSLMPGSAGGLNANVNRWRSQMGLPPLDEAGIAALPKKPFFNRDATYIEMDGDFSGFGATDAKKDYRMLGLIHSADEATIFVKLTGPRTVVEENTAQFEAFCQSISPNSAFLNQQ